MNSTKKLSLWMLLAGVLIAALYGQFLHNPIVFDDLYFFLQDNEGHSAIEQFATPQPLALRALPYATLAWSAQWLGFDLLHFRIENLLLHWLVVMAMALFALRLYRAVLPAAVPNENTSRMVAILSVVSLFAIHPLAVYGAGYLVQRSIVMATLFSVLALTAYLHGSERRSSIWLWASVALYFLATHSKEHVVMLPAVVVAMTVLLHEDWRARLRQQWMVLLAFAAVGLFAYAVSGSLCRRGALRDQFDRDARRSAAGACAFLQRVDSVRAVFQIRSAVAAAQSRLDLGGHARTVGSWSVFGLRSGADSLSGLWLCIN